MQVRSWKVPADATNCDLPEEAKVRAAAIRTVHYYAGDDVPVLLLALIDKGKDENLSKAERNELRVELAGYADDYRKGVIEKVAALNK